MKPDEFIDYAELLAVQPTVIPPQARSITSRAYYGAFHLAASFVASLTKVKHSKHDAHVWLLASRHPDAFEAGKLLAMLNNNRIKADYRLEDSRVELPAAARMNVECARDVQRLLIRCENVPVEEIVTRR
ncbi:hypothetical protein [Anatilimnocola floriformis]|uniref:hypothetical protein n=1 Tax=Anatilimnocola floriformis TaxID=2948575 RepID=UPI0020C235E6|nr:hypothetical protein [Anatilimnocola floriformis]